MFDWGLKPAEAEWLHTQRQHFAAGFMLGDDECPCARFARAISEHLDRCDLPVYAGGRIYPERDNLWLPSGTPQCLWQFYVHLGVNPEAIDWLDARADSDWTRAIVQRVRDCARDYPLGGGYTHSIVHFERALREGLSGYRARVEAALAGPCDAGASDLYKALLVVIDAIDRFRLRIAEMLSACSFTDTQHETNRLRLLAAFSEGLPMRPVRSFDEAMIATTLLYALDGPDDLGRVDQYLWPWFDADCRSGRTTREEAVLWLRELWGYVDANNAWNVALGGSDTDGREASNTLTECCLSAARGLRRPNLALRVRRDTPDAIWENALDCLATGNGLPALYCEERYLQAIEAAHLGISPQEARNYAFGGCTELMVQGCSNVGSLEGDFHLLSLLDRVLPELLPVSETFDELICRLENRIRQEIEALTGLFWRNQELRAQWQPCLIRSLLVDDCIERGRSFSAGGARCNWSVVNVVGLSNVIDSLWAVRALVYESHVANADTMLAALAANWDGYEALRQAAIAAPKFGNDDPDVDALAHRLSNTVYHTFQRYATWRGGRHICGTLMFVTYGWFGATVGATPDGRHAGAPVADSAGPVQGRDRNGPTAMLRSVASLDQLAAPGTLVVNIRLARSLFGTPEGRARIRALIEGYFDLGGMQLQITVVDREVLEDALRHPERYSDLIIRIGGYSEYWANLTDDLRQAVLERTEHR